MSNQTHAVPRWSRTGIGMLTYSVFALVMSGVFAPMGLALSGVYIAAYLLNRRAKDNGGLLGRYGLAVSILAVVISAVALILLLPHGGVEISNPGNR